jgi:hypothetical protein
MRARNCNAHRMPTIAAQTHPRMRMMDVKVSVHRCALPSLVCVHACELVRLSVACRMSERRAQDAQLQLLAAAVPRVTVPAVDDNWLFPAPARHTHTHTHAHTHSLTHSLTSKPLAHVQAITRYRRYALPARSWAMRLRTVPTTLSEADPTVAGTVRAGA